MQINLFCSYFPAICHMNGFLFIDGAVLEWFGTYPESYIFMHIHMLHILCYVYTYFICTCKYIFKCIYT